MYSARLVGRVGQPLNFRVPHPSRPSKSRGFDFKLEIAVHHSAVTSLPSSFYSRHYCLAVASTLWYTRCGNYKMLARKGHAPRNSNPALALPEQLPTRRGKFLSVHRANRIPRKLQKTKGREPF